MKISRGMGYPGGGDNWGTAAPREGGPQGTVALRAW